MFEIDLNQGYNDPILDIDFLKAIFLLKNVFESEFLSLKVF